MDHLVFYVLQSAHFTALPSIEPALAAREHVEWQKQGRRPGRLLPRSMEARVDAFLKAIGSKDRDARLGYFRGLLEGTPRADRKATVAAQFTRTLTFLYRQEFVSRGPEVSKLYGTRGLSTDTAIEAGYAVHAGLGVLKGLDPSWRVRRVLIIGPGMDLAPRTGMIEEGPPESYQPWAVLDALLALDLSRLDDLDIVAADINPRVVQHLARSDRTPPVLTLVTGLKEGPALRLSSDYREYFAALGTRIGRIENTQDSAGDRPAKRVRVDARSSSVLDAHSLNVVTDRLTGEPFDLVIATNVLVYFQPLELTLALANISSMLRPGGALLHNEVRPGFAEDAARVGLTLEQSRQVVIATVSGAPPLADTVFVYRRQQVR